MLPVSYHLRIAYLRLRALASRTLIAAAVLLLAGAHRLQGGV
jgi:hypothetical protein